MNFDKIKLKTVPEDGSNEYPDPNYVDKAKRKLMTQSSGPAVHDEGDSGASNSTAVASSKCDNCEDDYVPTSSIGTLGLLSNTSTVNKSDDNCCSIPELTSGIGILDIIPSMTDKFGTSSINKIHNTSGQLGILLGNVEGEMNTVKGKVYATLVALLEELNDASSRLKDTANVAIITEVKQQIENISNLEEVTYSDIVNINNSILQIAAGY